MGSRDSIAVTQETYHVGVAPNELRRPSRDWSVIARRLGLPVHTPPADTWQDWVEKFGVDPESIEGVDLLQRPEERLAVLHPLAGRLDVREMIELRCPVE